MMPIWMQIFGAGGTVIASGIAAWAAIYLQSKRWDEKHQAKEADDRAEFRKTLLGHVDRLNEKMRGQDDRIADLQRDVLNCERDKIDLYRQVNELQFKLGCEVGSAGAKA